MVFFKSSFKKLVLIAANSSLGISRIISSLLIGNNLIESIPVSYFLSLLEISSKLIFSIY